MMEEIIYRKATVDDCRELSILKRISANYKEEITSKRYLYFADNVL